MVRAGYKETDMSKTNDDSRSAALEDHRPLADIELDAVSGGLVVNAIIAVLIPLLLPPKQV